MLESQLIDNESSLRLISFLSVFLILALWEWRFPRRSLTMSKSLRWINNLGLMLLNTLVLRFALPILAVGLAIQVQQQQWGLLQYANLPLWLEIIFSIFLLDLAIYWQHRLMHTVPWLWRMHRMHHSDLDLDVTSAVRFHPFEIVLSMLYKLAIIALLGPSVIAVIVFEILLNAFSLFNHANGFIPERWDKKLRIFFVTPDMHRIHHSKFYRNETNSNYGVLTSTWDKLFKSYSDEPKEGQMSLTLGLDGFSSTRRAVHLFGLLLTPFNKPATTDSQKASTITRKNKEY